jgi:hypothetical protein
MTTSCRQCWLRGICGGPQPSGFGVRLGGGLNHCFGANLWAINEFRHLRIYS